MLVEEATAAGRFVMAHAQATDGIKAASPHRHPLDRARHLPRRRGHRHDARARDLPRAHARGARIGVLEARDRGIPVPQVMIDKTVMVMETHAASIRAAVEAGVKVAMGTDSGVVAPRSEPAGAGAHGGLRDEPQPRRWWRPRRPRPSSWAWTTSWARWSPASGPMSSSSRATRWPTWPALGREGPPGLEGRRPGRVSRRPGRRRRQSVPAAKSSTIRRASSSWYCTGGDFMK